MLATIHQQAGASVLFLTDHSASRDNNVAQVSVDGARRVQPVPVAAALGVSLARVSAVLCFSSLEVEFLLAKC